MAPPPSISSPVHPGVREVTEDTPPDLLEGTMEVIVVLPSGRTTRVTLDRKTPMMDLLIQSATSNKLNPGDHIVQVRDERGFEMPYTPSTPIGTLDKTIVEIVPKSRVSDYIIVKKPSKLANQPFEHTFRLQVHLPRNQLYVMRVGMKTVLEDILREVCQEKNLDFNKYEIRHPGNLDEKLPLHGTLGEFGLHEITIVSKSTKINPSVSTADIIALQKSDEHRVYCDPNYKYSRSSVGDSSVSSSGSTGSARGLSPTRSDDSRSVSPFPMHSSSSRRTGGSNMDVSMSRPPPAPVHKSMSMSNMLSTGGCGGGSPSPTSGANPNPSTGRYKKRVAPAPPPLLKAQTEMCLFSSKKREAPKAPGKSSSMISPGFQLDQSIKSISPNDNEANDGIDHKYDRQSSAPAMLSRQTASKSTSNLTTTSSTSNTSIASSTGGTKKRRAPAPPLAVLPVLKPQTEVEEEDIEASSSSSVPTLRQPSTAPPPGPISVSTSSVKEDEQYSSAVSSLSSPGSYLSSSSSSSPLPRTDSPESEAVVVSSKDSGYNASRSSGILATEAGIMQAVGDSSQVPSAPLPPPRTKQREVSVEETEDVAPQPQPRPWPKPRTDRVVHTTADNNKTQETDNEEVKTESQPMLSSQLRNPLAKFGVQVLPEAVVKERSDRLAQIASSSSEDNEDNKEQQTPSLSSTNPTRRKSSGDALPESTSSKPAPLLPPSSKKSAFQQVSNKQTKSFSSAKLRSEESDDLEENMELFEPKINDDANILRRRTSKSSVSSEGSNSSQRKVKGKAPVPPTQQQQQQRPPLKPRTSSSIDLEKEESSNRTLSRANSEHRGTQEVGEQDGKLLNRWGNLESLNEISDASEASNRNSTNRFSTSTDSLSNNLSKPSEDRHNNQSKPAPHPDSDEWRPASSESEISFSDSGVRTLDHHGIISEDKSSAQDPSGNEEESEESYSRSSLQSSAKVSQGMDLHDSHHNPTSDIEQKAADEKETAMQASVKETFDQENEVLEQLSAALEDPDSDEKESDAIVNPPKERKLSKSESFSTASDFEIAHMRRKKFAEQTLVMSTVHSSSEKNLSNLNSPTEDTSQNRGSEFRLGTQERKELNEEGSANNPEALAALQAQFEKWKQDFIKQQQSTVHESAELQSSKDKETSSEMAPEEQKSQIEFKEDVTATGEIEIKEEKNNKPVSITLDKSELDGRTVNNNEEKPQSPVRMRKEPTTEFRYRGPPTIRMSSWTERPKTTVSVKKDEDYIMGYGQADPKVLNPADSPRSTLTRTQSVKPLSPRPVVEVKQTVANSPSSSPQPALESTVPPRKSIKGISAALNARPASWAASESPTRNTIKSVLSAWKQREEGNEQQQGSRGPPPEIDMYQTEDSVSNSSQPVVPSVPVIAADNVNDKLKDKEVKILSSGDAIGVSEAKEVFNQPNVVDKPSRNRETQSLGRSIFRMASLSRKSEVPRPLQNQNAETTSESPIATPPKRPVSVHISTISNPDDERSLKDKMNFFQGIKPAESPGRETPVPAVDMKNSIATIQKAFETRSGSSTPSPTGTLRSQKSTTLPRQNSKTNGEPVIPQYYNSTESAQTLPKDFQSMSSTQMVQKVLGKAVKTHDTFRRSPSPLSITSSPGRGTPVDRDRGIDSPTSPSVRVTDEIKKFSTPNNKTVIAINSGAGQIKIHTPDTSVAHIAAKLQGSVKFKNAQNEETNKTVLVINGDSGKRMFENKLEKRSSLPVVKAQEKGRVPPPPPPPPAMDASPRPKELTLGERPNSLALSSPGSKASTPTSPNSDPRSEIFNVIKNSNGNFGLKKTGATFLLK